VLQGAEVRFLEYVQAGKAREVSVEPTATMYEKFGRGAGEQAISRYLHWLNSSPLVSLPQRLTHFYGGIGFYISQPLAKYANFLYLITVILIGVSGFAAKQSEVLYGVIGIWMAQSIVTTGLAEIVLENGFRGIGVFLRRLPGLLPFFQFHILTNAIGFQRALKAETRYVPTGRGFCLAHTPSAQLFRVFAPSHTRWGLWALFVMSVGIAERQTYPIVWSFLFIVNVLAALYVPFVFNRGGTPLDVGLRHWIRLQYEDITVLWRMPTLPGVALWKWVKPIYICVVFGGLSLFCLYVLPACPKRLGQWITIVAHYVLHLIAAAVLFSPLAYSFGIGPIYAFSVLSPGPILLAIGFLRNYAAVGRINRTAAVQKP
jgi:hypothetical protein